MDDQPSQNTDEELDDVIERLFDALKDIRIVQRRRKIGEEVKSNIDEYLVELYEHPERIPISQDWQVDDTGQLEMALKQIDTAQEQLDEILTSRRNNSDYADSLEELFSE